MSLHDEFLTEELRRPLATVIGQHLPKELSPAQVVLVASPRLHDARRLLWMRTYMMTYRPGASIAQAIQDASWSLTERAVLRNKVSRQDQELNLILLPLFWLWAFGADRSDLADCWSQRRTGEPLEGREEWNRRRAHLLILVEAQHPSLNTKPFWRSQIAVEPDVATTMENWEARVVAALPRLIEIFETLSGPGDV